MYEAQTKFIAAFKEDLQNNVPEAYKYLCEEVSGAATSLEYYGMFGAAVKEAFEQGLIPVHYKEKVIAVNKAVLKIYGN